MRLFYAARYRIDIGPHVFPTEKYGLVIARLIEEGVVGASDIVSPGEATWDDLAGVHTAEYLAKMRDGTMTTEDVAQLELPWSAAMVDAFRVMVGGTVQAARFACGLDESRLPAANWAFILVAAFTTRFRTMAKVSVRSTTSLSRCAICSATASSARRSLTSMFITATAPRSSSSQIRVCSPSPCTSSTTIRCGSQKGRSTSVSRMAQAMPGTCASWSGPFPSSWRAIRSACSISRARIRTRTISSAVCGCLERDYGCAIAPSSTPFAPPAYRSSSRWRAATRGGSKIPWRSTSPRLKRSGAA